MKFKKLVPYLVSILIIILTYFSIGSIDFYQLKNIPINLFFIATIFYILSKIINVLRFSSFYNGNNKIALFFYLMYCNFILAVAPFRSGEFSYIYSLKKIYNEKTSKNISNLLIIRVFDLFVIISIFLVSSIFIESSMGSMIKNIMFVIFIIFELLFLLYFFTRLRTRITDLIKLIGIKKIKKLLDMSLESFQNINTKQSLFLMINSFVYWLIRYLLGFILLYLLGINLSIFEIFFITSLTVLIGILPIQTVSNFGIHEVSWAYLLSLYGITFSDGFLISLKFHIIVLLPTIILGIISWIITVHKLKKL